MDIAPRDTVCDLKHLVEAAKMLVMVIHITKSEILAVQYYPKINEVSSRRSIIHTYTSMLEVVPQVLESP